MAWIPPTDLILNADGTIYHLGLLPEHIGDLVIAVGDPDRVDRVSQHFERIDQRVSKREFRTHVGVFKGKRITVISSGIGNDNVELMLTELDALVNIDLKRRTIHGHPRKLNIVRIGTSGAISPDIPVGSFLVSALAIGIDTLNQYYPFEMDEHEQTIANDIREQCAFAGEPYVTSGSLSLRDQFGYDMHKGNTLTAPGFYAAQGRRLRVEVRHPRLLDTIAAFRTSKAALPIHNFEMETAAYYGLARLMGHEALSVNAILANRALQQFANDPEAIVDELIVTILNRV